MNLTAVGEVEEESPPAASAEIQLPAEIDWEMLDKWRFFVLGAALFSGVSFVLYPAVVLKTRLQCSSQPLSCRHAAMAILHHDGPRGFYRGFATSLTGTIPARALYMTALEVTKSAVGAAASRLGVAEPAAAAAASAAAGLSAAMASQIVWTPIDVISQRLMVQGSQNPSPTKYLGGIDAFWKILRSDGLRGLYRGFGMSILTYAPSNAVWWASYSVSQRIIWGGIGYYLCRRGDCDSSPEEGSSAGLRPDYKMVAVVQGVSAAMAGGASCLVTMPLDTIKTRMQVMDDDSSGGRSSNKRSSAITIGRTMRNLLKEGGWGACYRGLGPRWASMSMSATTMITTYEFLKRLSAKNQDSTSV